MTAESPILVRSYRVGKYTCTWTIQKPVIGMAVHATCEWAPETPSHLKGSHLRAYRKGRGAVFAELEKITGMRTMVAEI